MSWSKLPDVIAVALLAWAFASVARRSQAPVSSHWLTGWLLIVVHFLAGMFTSISGMAGFVLDLVSILALAWAGLLFIWAAIPYRSEKTSRYMLGCLFAVYTLYIWTMMASGPTWLQNLAAILMGFAPLAIALSAVRRFHHPLRWVTVGLQCALAVVLVEVQMVPVNGPGLALNAALFTVFFSCSLQFWFLYPRSSAGAFITIAGFFTWASVFVFAPIHDLYFASVQIQDEVWNLPKYVVAVGMILLLLEDQIAHNRHLALHDALTGLPNRRLFQDRLASALERARRTSSKTALLILDLDRFKHVNDTMGHHAGDLLLQNVARLLDGRVRRSDTVARTGGDEFAIILESPTSREEAIHVGRSLLDLLSQPITLENSMVQVGASIGVAVFPEDAGDMESLCITADLRMYDNKRSNVPADRDALSELPLPLHPAHSAGPQTEISLAQ